MIKAQLGGMIPLNWAFVMFCDHARLVGTAGLTLASLAGTGSDAAVTIFMIARP